MTYRVLTWCCGNVERWLVNNGNVPSDVSEKNSDKTSYSVLGGESQGLEYMGRIHGEVCACLGAIVIFHHQGRLGRLGATVSMVVSVT